MPKLKGLLPEYGRNLGDQRYYGLLIKEGKLEVFIALNFNVYEWKSLPYSKDMPVKLFKQLGYRHLKIVRRQMTDI